MKTKKMTEAERGKIEEFVEAGHTLSEDQASALLAEADRARASEDRKDVIIKTLADALMHAMTPGVPLTEALERGTAALRLAGR